MASLSSLLDAAFIKIGFGILCVWWAVWSLLDTYLLPWTPVSEIALLALGVTMIATGDCRLCCFGSLGTETVEELAADEEDDHRASSSFKKKKKAPVTPVRIEN